MGCGVSCVSRVTMSLFGRQSINDGGSKAILDRKLYIAKESPEPEFDLSDCQLKQVPSGTFSICKVYRKEYLYLQNNKLLSLQEGGQLSDLYHLKVLNVNSNLLTNVPDEIRFLVNLKELHIQNNLLRNLPECMQDLHSLQILDVSKNKLTCLTPSLGTLKSLRELNITGNSDLKELCSELCYATNIVELKLDETQFTFPPSDICKQGTEEIMKYLCMSKGLEYRPPLVSDENIFTVQSSISVQNPFLRRNTQTWEEQEASIIKQENRLHQVAKEQREKFLSQILQNQLVLDTEILKVHEAKETERQNLLKAIQDDEKEIECLVKNFIQSDNLKPEIIQQQLAYEQAEHDRLLEITRQNYDNIKRSDVIRAMEMLMIEDCSIQNSKKIYMDTLNNVRHTLLMEDLEGARKLGDLLKAKEQSRTALVGQLLEDQDVQKALVASLLERTDTKSWSLNQEISLISSHLSRLSVIEQEKKKLHINYNYNELLQQRVQLVNLLNDLFAQQTKRRKQLVDTLKEMETESFKSTDFWLQSYQKLIDTAPKTLLDIGKSLDPMFANYLLQEGVIHCLPFLVKFIFSNEPLMAITSDELKANGVSLASDRKGILNAIKCYVGAKSENHNYEVSTVQPTAPPEELLEEQKVTGVVSSTETEGNTVEAECVVCMDARSEVVFIPCGHMCCCYLCGNEDMKSCPMCRSEIERIIKVIIA